MPRLLIAALLAAFALALPARAQSDAYWRDTFAVPGFALDTAHTFEHGPHALARRGSDVYVGGEFDRMDDVTARHVARWDGAAWHPVGGGVSGPVYALLAAPDGALYAAGWFTEAYQTDGTAVTVNGVARWDGTAWAPLGGGLLPYYEADEAVGSALAAGPDGAVYVGGTFVNAVNPDGATVEGAGVMRWTGSAWESLGQVLAQVEALAFSPAGELYAGGYIGGITNPDGTSLETYGIARYAGGAWTAVGGGMSSSLGIVHTLAFVGPTLYVGGRFDDVRQNSVVTITARNIARWDGTAWSEVGGGVSSTVTGLAPDGAGGVWVAGLLTGADLGTPPQPPNVAAAGLLHWTGSAWAPVSALPPTSNPLFGRTLRTVLAEPGGALLAGGSFGALIQPDGSALPAHGLARLTAGTWTPVTALDARDGLGNPQTVSALRPTACGRMLVGGSFDSAGPRASAAVAAWGAGTWTGFGGGLGYDDSAGSVSTLAAAGCDGGAEQFYAAGSFSRGLNTDGGPTASFGVIYWNGSTWEALGRGVNTGAVNALAADAEGVYVGGGFPSVLDASGAQVPYRNLARWQPGAGWTAAGAFPAGGSGSVYALAKGPDGSLYVGGSFGEVQQPGGAVLPVPQLARWTGAAWEAFGGPPGNGTWMQAVRALAFGPDGRLYVGGGFTTVLQPDGTPLAARHVAAWDGTAWHALGGGPGAPDDVRALAFDAAGRLYAEVHVVGDTAFAVWDGLGWTPQGAGLSAGYVRALAFGSDSLLYVGGDFQRAGAYDSPALAVWDARAATPAEPGAPSTVSALTLTAAPNPAHGHIALHFTLPTAAAVRLAVYDALGREVAVLSDATLGAGSHEAPLDAGRLAPGVYLARLKAGTDTAVRRLTVVR